jgi:hypothetical protein
MLDERQLLTVPTVSTPEAVALALFQAIVRAEGKSFDPERQGSADRKWILDTYAECLNTIQNPAHRVALR